MEDLREEILEEETPAEELAEIEKDADQDEEIHDTEVDLSEHEKCDDEDIAAIKAEIVGLQGAIADVMKKIESQREWIEEIIGTGAVLKDADAEPEVIEDNADEVAEADRRFYEMQKAYLD